MKEDEKCGDLLNLSEGSLQLYNGRNAKNTTNFFLPSK